MSNGEGGMDADNAPEREQQVVRRRRCYHCGQTGFDLELEWQRTGTVRHWACTDKDACTKRRHAKGRQR